MEPQGLLLLSLALFGAFLAVGAVDAVVYHQLRFRLAEHPETRCEHATHTARAVLLPPTLVALYAAGRGALVVAAVLVALDFVAAGLDVACERESRRRFGGLPHGEYAIHLAATVLHVAALATAFIARASAPAAAVPGWISSVVLVLAAGSAVAALQHLHGLVRGSLREAGAS